MGRYAVGLDYGTNSVRALIVDTDTGKEVGSRVWNYAHGEAGILLNQDYTRLRKAHTFLRWLIDSLRVVRGNAKDVTMPQENTEEMAFLARRMNFTNAPLRLHTELMRYTEDVREMNNRLLTSLS